LRTPSADELGAWVGHGQRIAINIVTRAWLAAECRRAKPAGLRHIQHDAVRSGPFHLDGSARCPSGPRFWEDSEVLCRDIRHV